MSTEANNKWDAIGVFVSDTPETMGGKFCIRKNGVVLAVTWDKETRKEIVHALNSHAELLNACMAARNALTPSRNEEEDQALEIIDRVLEKAKP